MLAMQQKPKTLAGFVQRYPHVLAKIKEAGDFVLLEQAAVVLRDAVERRKNYSDWVLTEHNGDAMKAVIHALKTVH